MAHPRNILVLFPKDWDRLQFDRPEFRDSYRFLYEGFDLFSFPENVRLIGFDLFTFVDRILAKYRGVRIDGVLSNHEQIGALAAAMVAKRLGLPGLDPVTLITAQHKFYAREALKDGLPELMPERYGVMPYTIRSINDVPLPFPFYVKPVKATFSVLARRVDNLAQLRAHLSFRPWETFIIKRLVRPFNDVMKSMTEYSIDAHHLIGESLLEGIQVNVDGAVIDGKPTVLGIVDAVMYPGTDAFLRWDYPSRLPAALQAKAIAAAQGAISTLGYGHGFFNVELMIDPERGSIKLIEINARMASQFSDLYRNVSGLDLHEILVKLSCGEAVNLQSGRVAHARGASFVFRKFDGTPLGTPPTPAKLAWLAAFDPDAHLMLYLKRGSALAREMKWLGSHRYAVLNMTAESEVALVEKYEAVKQAMGFETAAERRVAGEAFA